MNIHVLIQVGPELLRDIPIVMQCQGSILSSMISPQHPQKNMNVFFLLEMKERNIAVVLWFFLMNENKFIFIFESTQKVFLT